MSRFENDLVALAETMRLEFENSIPAMRRDLLSTGCPPERVDEQIEATRALVAETIERRIARLRDLATMLGATLPEPESWTLQ